MKQIGIIFIVFLLFAGCSQKTKKLNEHYYQAKLCKKLDGKMEYVLKDKTRVDCLTNKYAIEVDFAKKWAEGVGQSLYYSYMTSKQPAVALIVGSNDQKHLKRLQKLAKRYNIKIFVIEK
jgi:serine kinase of HPr protein (carbohydrate metabolism regulator)